MEGVPVELIIEALHGIVVIIGCAISLYFVVASLATLVILGPDPSEGRSPLWYAMCALALPGFGLSVSLLI